MLGLKQIESISSWWEAVESPHFRKRFMWGKCVPAHSWHVRTATSKVKGRTDRTDWSPLRFRLPLTIHSDSLLFCHNMPDMISCGLLIFIQIRVTKIHWAQTYPIVFERQRWGVERCMQVLSAYPHQQHPKCKYASRGQQVSHDLDREWYLFHLLGISCINMSVNCDTTSTAVLAHIFIFQPTVWFQENVPVQLPIVSDDHGIAALCKTVI